MPFYALRPETVSKEFAMFAGECEARTGHTLRCLDVVIDRMGYVAVDAMVQDDPRLPLIPYTLYFAQGDDAAEDLRRIELVGYEKWLHVLYGSTEFFTEAQKQ